MNYKILVFLVSFSLLLSTSNINARTSKLVAFNAPIPAGININFLFNSLNSKKFNVPKITCFAQAIDGFFTLKSKGLVSKNILTLIDFSLPSSAKRLWVIDMNSNTVLYNTVVSHGMNSGGEFATSFSNSQSSNKSSLGFYATGETYIGKNGFSMKLDGLEKGVNSNARSRAVVMHGAYYANPSILNSQNYLGRSQGCPALPENLSKQVINTIKGKSCLFIYHPSRTSKFSKSLL
jgi:L,D-transpeptidase catalytic domain